MAAKQRSMEHLKIDNFELFLNMPFTTLNTDSFQALFNHASIGILITDAAGEIKMANRYIGRQFGYEDGELVGQKIEVLVPERMTARHTKYRTGFHNNPHSRPMGLGMELSGRRKDGVEFPVEVSLGYYKIDDQSYAMAFVNDITQRKETEQAIIQLNAHLEQKVKEGSQSLALTVEQLGNQIKETERKDAELERVNTFLNNIWNHAGAIIFVCNKDGVINFFNPAAEKWLGYTAAEVVNKMKLDQFLLKEELERKAEELSEATGKTVRPNFDVFVASTAQNKGDNLEWHYRRKDKSTFFVSLNVTPLKDNHGAVSNYLGIAIDISDKKKAESELLTALEKEKELNELKSRFVSMASHEFRTPLSAVLSSAYLLSKYVKEEEQPQREKHIQRIVSSVTNLTEILNDFLSVGKIEEGNIRPNFRQFDVREMVKDIIKEVNHLLKKGQDIVYTHKGKNATVNLDTSMLKHILINLLSNAVKFSPEGSAIDITTQTTKDKIIISVSDKGIGIPEADQENLFKRFFRSSNATNIQGTGLGLHIVSKYTELMDGIIDCRSELDKGTTFTITFLNKITTDENSAHN